MHVKSDGNCCGGSSCNVDCNTILSLCIQTGEASHNSLDCLKTPLSLGFIGGDNVNFTGFVGNQKNPLVQHLSTLPSVCFTHAFIHAIVLLIFHLIYIAYVQNGYQLAIISTFVWSALIDRIFVKIPASALEKPSSPVQTYDGEFSAATITLSYSLECSSSYTLCTNSTLLQCVSEKDCSNSKLLYTYTKM